MIVEEHVSDYEQAKANIPEDMFIPFFETFPFEVVNEKTRYQLIEDGRGCLTINGSNSDNEQRTVNLEFVKSDDQWLINHIQIVYYEDDQTIDAYPSEATCPEKI